MCGLIGIAGDLALKDEAAMKRLFLADFFRGPDSTGLAAIRKTGDVHIAKLASNPIDLFDMTRFKTALTGGSSKVFIGHNRAATKGAVNNNNAHPYQFGHIVGAHNGTLETSSWRALEEAIGEKYDVDSMAIFAAIEKLGLEETVKLLEGAWALVFYDSKENTLNFIRNDKRPLWYAFTEDFKRIFWASEWEMIDTAVKMAGANDYKLFREEKTNFGFFQTEVNTHYKFDVEALAKGGTSRPKAKAKVLKGKEPAAVIVGDDPFGRGANGGRTSTTTSSHNTGTSATRERRAQRVRHFAGTSDNPLAGFMPLNAFEHTTECKCSYCDAAVKYEIGKPPQFTYYERDNLLLCATCGPAETNQIRIYPVKFSDYENL